MSRKVLGRGLSALIGEDSNSSQSEELLEIDLDLIENASKNKRDSLLQVVSDVKNDVPVSSLSVEYWKSPLNYRGYKMAKNKIILYGILSEDDLKIYRFDGNTYIKNSSGAYKLEYSGDFKQLEKIVDERVLLVLK